MTLFSVRVVEHRCIYIVSPYGSQCAEYRCAYSILLYHMSVSLGSYFANTHTNDSPLIVEFDFKVTSHFMHSLSVDLKVLHLYHLQLNKDLNEMDNRYTYTNI